MVAKGDGKKSGSDLVGSTKEMTLEGYTIQGHFETDLAAIDNYS